MKREVKQLLTNIRRTFALMWRMDRGNLLWYLVFIGVQVASSLLMLYFGSRVIGSLFSYLSSGGASQQTILTYLGLAVLMGTLEQVAWRMLQYFENRAFLKWNTWLAPEFNARLASLDIQRFEDSEFNKLINKVLQDYSWKPNNFAFKMLHLLHATVRLLSITIILAKFAAWMLPVLLLAVVPSLIVESRQAKLRWHIWGYKGDTSRRYYKLIDLMQHKQNIMELRIFGLNSYFLQSIRELLEEFNGTQNKALNRFITPAVLSRLVEGVLVGLLELWLIMGVIGRKFGIEQYSFYSGTIQQFNSSAGVLMNTLSLMYDYNLFMTDYYTLMDTPSLIPAPKNPVAIAKGTLPRIEFRDVSFKYPTGKHYVFKGLSLTIEPGERIALVGENGVGKSTLIKLLLRYYDVTSGQIFVDGVDVKDLDLDTWYRCIGVLFQDFNHYPYSIGKNISLGAIRRKPDQGEIEQAAALSGLSGMVKEYKNGYDTILDNSFDEGVEPSGGQWQRVALARAFYRKAPVLILDEPTAAIDAKAEYEIFNNIFKEHTDRTAIIVSHRFSTVRKADRILVFENGKVTESGTHMELMNNGGLYHEMFSKQAEGYKD